MKYKITTNQTWYQTLIDLSEEFRLWGIDDSHWEVNYPRGARLDRAIQLEEDRTVILKYKKAGKEIVLKYGQQNRAVDNLRALYLTINDMRMTEKRGVSDLVQTAYKQLGSGEMISTSEIVESPYEVLGVVSSTSLEACEAVYRTMSKKYHPDSGVSANIEMFRKITLAIEEIRKLK